MLLHKEWGQHLRTGNWFFKYAGMIGLARRFKTTLALPDHFIWKYLENPPNLDDGIPADLTLKEETWEPCLDFWESHREDIVTKNVNISLDTFFQSPKNWENYEEDIREAFRFKQEYKDDAIEWILKEIIPLSVPVKKRNVVGISIRRGDFVDHGLFFQLGLDYYNQAIDTFDKETTLFVFFSDDIEWCKANFNLPYQIFAPANNTHLTDKENYHRDPMFQMILGTAVCNDWIISNSTFSWWLAYITWLNKPEFTTVIRPNKVFRGEFEKYNDEHHYPKEWKTINR